MRNWSYLSINQQVTFDSHAAFQPSRRKIAQYYEDPTRVPGRELEQIDCQGVTDERCFNLSECEEDVLTVYAYPKTFSYRYIEHVRNATPQPSGW